MEEYTLDKKQRSVELNELNRILIDFKSLLNQDKFKIFNTNGVVYFMLDEDGLTKVKRLSNHTFLEKSLDVNKYYEIDFAELKKITSMKKAEVTNISYDTSGFKFETVEGNLVVKPKDVPEKLLRSVILTEEGNLNTLYKLVTYDKQEQTLKDSEGNLYPFKITFSDDIWHKLKNSPDDSRIFLRTLTNNSFNEIIIISPFGEYLIVENILYMFNYRVIRKAGN